MQIPISKIRIENRSRVDFGSLQELADSIEKIGQIQPISVEKRDDGTYRLLDGERRLRASILLEKDTIEATVVSKSLNELERKIIEVQANIVRKDFTWQEHVKATQELVKLREEFDKRKPTQKKGSTQQEVAEELGVSPQTISNDLTLAEGLEYFPQLAKIEKKTNAYKNLLKFREKALIAELASRGELESIPTLKLGKAEDLIQEEEDESFDLVLLDLPWGIDIYETSQQSKYEYEEDWKDSKEYSETLAETLLPHLYRVMKPKSFIYVFFAIETYDWWFKLLRKYFGKGTNPIPLIWDKQSHGTVAQGTAWPRSYETILYARKGLAKLNKVKKDLISLPRPATTKRIHTAEKAIGLYETIIDTTVPPSSKILDPTAGSGASLIAAMNCNTDPTGYEADTTVHAKATERLKAYAQEKEEERIGE